MVGAVIDNQRLGMWMSGSENFSSRITAASSRMAAAVGPAEAEGNGVYRLHVELPMAGEWSLSVTARVPGEAQPVRGTVRVRAA